MAMLRMQLLNGLRVCVSGGAFHGGSSSSVSSAPKGPAEAVRREGFVGAATGVKCLRSGLTRAATGVKCL